MLGCIDKIYFPSFRRPHGDTVGTLQFYQSTNKNDAILDAAGLRFAQAPVPK